MNAVAFDAYGTLFDVLSIARACEQCAPGQGDELARVWRVKQLQYSWLRSVMGRYADFWQVTDDALVYAANRLAITLTVDDRRALMDAYLTLDAFPDVESALSTLRARQLRLAILSNGAPGMLSAVVRHARLEPLFDTIVSVDRVKVYKPDPRVYELLVRELGTVPSEVMFVSANAWDIAGAGACGLTTCWIQRDTAEPPDELGIRPSMVVRSLAELAAG